MKIEPVFGSQPWNLFNQKSDVASNLENGLEATLSSNKEYPMRLKNSFLSFCKFLSDSN